MIISYLQELTHLAQEHSMPFKIVPSEGMSFHYDVCIGPHSYRTHTLFDYDLLQALMNLKGLIMCNDTFMANLAKEALENNK